MYSLLPSRMIDTNLEGAEMDLTRMGGGDVEPQGKVWMTGYPCEHWRYERRSRGDIDVRLEPYHSPGMATNWKAVQTLDSGSVPGTDEKYFWLGIVQRPYKKPNREPVIEQRVVWAIVGHHGSGEYI